MEDAAKQDTSAEVQVNASQVLAVICDRCHERAANRYVTVETRPIDPLTNQVDGTICDRLTHAACVEC